MARRVVQIRTDGRVQGAVIDFEQLGRSQGRCSVMASKRKESDPANLTVAILRDIREEIRQTNSRLDGTNSRLDSTNSRLESLERVTAKTIVRLESLEAVTTRGFERLEARFENLLEFSGAKYRDLEARVRSIEAQLGESESRP